MWKKTFDAKFVEPAKHERKRKQTGTRSYHEMKDKVELEMIKRRCLYERELSLNQRLKEYLAKRGINNHPLLLVTEQKVLRSQSVAQRMQRVVQFGEPSMSRTTKIVDSPSGSMQQLDDGESADADSSNKDSRSTKTPKVTNTSVLAGRRRGLQAYDIAENHSIEIKMKTDRYGYMQAKPEPPKQISFSSWSGTTDSDFIPKAEDVKKFEGRKRSLNFDSVLKVKGGPYGDGRSTAPWLNDRLKYSCRSIRFELPMDFLLLKKMTPMGYLLKYCRISESRQYVYKKAFEKKLPKNDKTAKNISYQQLTDSLRSIMGLMVGEKDIRSLLRLLRMSDEDIIEIKKFSVVCAVAERILYVTFAGRRGETGVNRSYLESADFDGLEWKLKGLDMKDLYLKKLLMSLG